MSVDRNRIFLVVFAVCYFISRVRKNGQIRFAVDVAADGAYVFGMSRFRFRGLLSEGRNVFAITRYNVVLVVFAHLFVRSVAGGLPLAVLMSDSVNRKFLFVRILFAVFFDGSRVNGFAVFFASSRFGCLFYGCVKRYLFAAVIRGQGSRRLYAFPGKFGGVVDFFFSARGKRNRKKRCQADNDCNYFL